MKKMSILDIKAEIEIKTGRQLVNIEMQVNNEGNIEKRSVYYLSKNISMQLKKREEYQEIVPTIIICITNFKFLNRNSYHSVVRLKFDKIIEETYVYQGYEEEQENLTDIIEMHFIELPKFIDKAPGVKTKLEQWLWAITGKEDKIEMAKSKNSRVKEAMELVEEILMDPKEREIYEEIEKARKDYSSGLRYAKEKGEKSKAIEIAKRMLREKNDIEYISKITGLTEEEIKKIENTVK